MDIQRWVAHRPGKDPAKMEQGVYESCDEVAEPGDYKLCDEVAEPGVYKLCETGGL